MRTIYLNKSLGERQVASLPVVYTISGISRGPRSRAKFLDSHPGRIHGTRPLRAKKLTNLPNRDVPEGREA